MIALVFVIAGVSLRDACLLSICFCLFFIFLFSSDFGEAVNKITASFSSVLYQQFSFPAFLLPLPGFPPCLPIERSHAR